MYIHLKCTYIGGPAFESFATILCFFNKKIQLVDKQVVSITKDEIAPDVYGRSI
mgnify:CR=1 FL=1